MAALIMSALWACGSKQSGFNISISSPECNNITVRLYRENDDRLELMDSAKFEMTKAHLSGNVSQPELMFIFVDNASDYLPIFIENGHIDIELNYQKLYKSVIPGSESERIFTDFIQSYSVYNDKMMGNSKMAQYANDNNDTIMIKSFENSQNSIKQEVIEFQRRFVQKYISHPIACYIISSQLMYSLEPDELEGLLDSIPDSNRNINFYMRAASHLQQINSTNQ